MQTHRLKKALHDLRRTLTPAGGGAATDAQLLARFVSGRDEGAFAALVRRHGPMVLGVCHRVLGHAEDAEDAFQATFLVLARKAASIGKREAVGSWLYQVAYRTALAARSRNARRRMHERQVEQMPHPAVLAPEPQDWRPLLDRELSRLGEVYRAALVLCDLEGRSRQEAARQLGVPESTLSSRLTRARALLAKRLARCGFFLPAGALAAALSEGGASAAVSAPLAAAVVKGAALAASGQAAGVSAPALLMGEVLKTMLMTKLKVYLATALVAVLLGASLVAYQAAGQAPRAEGQAQGRSLTELEQLRREVEILKLQMELVQEKVRVQGAEIRALKGKTEAAGKMAIESGTVGTGPVGLPHAGPGMAPGGAPAAPTPELAPPRPPVPAVSPPASQADTAPLRQLSVSGVSPPANALPAPAPKVEAAPPGVAGYGTFMPGTPSRPAPGSRPRTPGKATPLYPRGQGHGPEQEVEAALQFLRAAPDDGDARLRAAQALERALQQLQGPTRSGTPTATKTQPAGYLKLLVPARSDAPEAPPANVPANR